MSSARIAISAGGGAKPQWRPDGTEIYCIAPDRKMMAVPVKLTPTFEAGVAVPLFATNFAGTLSYDVTAGGRFLVNTLSNDDSSGSSAITIVTHWQSRLK